MGLFSTPASVSSWSDPTHRAARNRRLRTREPRELLSGPAAAKPIARAQAYLAIGAAMFGTVATLAPHPDSFNVAGLLGVQAVALAAGIALLVRAGRIPFGLLRLGPATATVLTTVAVYFSGDSTSAFAMLYLWVGLYAFYFPMSRLDGITQVLFAAVNYAFAIAITPAPEAFGGRADISHLVIAAGTLITAGILLTYLRGRVERLMERLTDAARTDALTGLPNRVALHRILRRELERSRPHGREFSLLLVDVDDFKRINERHGLTTGDELLIRLARAIEDQARLIDAVTRSGGEEFVVVLPETDPHRAFLIAEEIQATVRETFRPPTIELTVSIGVAAYPTHATGIDELLVAGDEALQAAKALGRDRAVIYSPEVTRTLGLAAGRASVSHQAHLATVLSLAEALDQRDASTARHSRTVGRLAEVMARELGLDERRVSRVRLAGILHDIGKIGVPDSILQKPGPLSPDEWDQMRRHPELGARILAGRDMEDVREWVLAHHERPDGNGYPKRLRGDQIPLEAAIVAVADAFEAMTNDRVYRLGRSHEQASEELRLCAGTQFDPRVVEALTDALARGGARLLA